MEKMNKQYFCALVVLLILVTPVPAPVPRCSPFFIINKLAEFTSFLSDSNPYFPLPPCEYGDWAQALGRGDFQATLLTATPENIMRHNFYEYVWLLKTGIPRLLRIAQGKEEMLRDRNILSEPVNRHYTPQVRTNKLGHTQRRPEIIDNEQIFNRVIKDKVLQLIYEGPDSKPTNFTPVGPVKRGDTVQNEYIINQPQIRNGILQHKSKNHYSEKQQNNQSLDKRISQETQFYPVTPEV